MSTQANGNVDVGDGDVNDGKEQKESVQQSGDVTAAEHQTSVLSNRFYHDTRLLTLVICLILVAGLSAFMVMPRMEDPVLAQRGGIITTILPGADPNRVESLITEPIENRLRDVEEIKEVRSNSRSGISVIVVELLDEIDQTKTDTVWTRVRGKLADVMPELPPESSRPTFEEIDVRAYALIFSVVWDHSSPLDYSILRRVARDLQDVVQSIPGTETVDRFGDPGEEVLVTFDPARLAAMNLDAETVAGALSSADAKQSAGVIRSREQSPATNSNGDVSSDPDLLLEIDNQFDSVSEIAETILAAGPDGQFVRAADVADIRVGTVEPPPRLASADGRPAISLGVLVRPNVRIDQWHAGVVKVLDEYQATMPVGLRLETVLDQNRYVEQRLSSLTSNLLLGGMAVAVVVLLIMGWRSAIIVTLTLPLASMMVLFGLRIMDVPIHQMSISGLIIALGLLIDNAIVVVDEVTLQLRRGASPAAAVSKTAKHLMIPLLGSTLTTALAFAPIVLMPGPAGEFVGSIAISVILAVSASLLLALTVIPALAAMIVRPQMSSKAVPRASRGPSLPGLGLVRDGFRWDWMTGWYKRFLHLIVRRPTVGISVALLFPILGFVLATQLSEQFFPPADRDQFVIDIELPTSASLESTIAASKIADEVIREEDTIRVDWFYGESAPTFYYNVISTRRGSPFFGQALVRVNATKAEPELLRRIQRRLDQRLPQARVIVKQLEQGPPFNAPIEVRLFGPDLERLRLLGQEIQTMLANVPSVTHTKTNLSETSPKVVLEVDEAAALVAGLRPQSIAGQLFRSLEGSIGGTVIEETQQMPVRIRVGTQSRRSLNDATAMELISTTN
ncbi:MAG: efflux RND transporter permease subunit, partial [Planctomycetota bacterium]